jgi:hypothetical protein
MKRSRRNHAPAFKAKVAPRASAAAGWQHYGGREILPGAASGTAAQESHWRSGSNISYEVGPKHKGQSSQWCAYPFTAPLIALTYCSTKNE